MEAMERLGVPRQIVAFVMPTGYSFNLDGSTLYLSLTAHVRGAGGRDRAVARPAAPAAPTLMLTSKGVAGVPRGALVILMGTVASFGLPAEPVFMILGIDALLDMLRTSVNVLGNCLATVVIARWEGEFEERPEEQALEAGFRLARLRPARAVAPEARAFALRERVGGALEQFGCAGVEVVQPRFREPRRTAIGSSSTGSPAWRRSRSRSGGSGGWPGSTPTASTGCDVQSSGRW